jgi:hypothetical protein
VTVTEDADPAADCNSFWLFAGAVTVLRFRSLEAASSK